MEMVIVTPVRLLGEGLAVALHEAKSLRIVGVAQGLHELRDVLNRCSAQLVLLDLSVDPDLSGVKLLAKEWSNLKLIALGLSEHEAEVIRCAKAGFSGYIPTDMPLPELERALSDVAQGRTQCPSEITASLMRALFSSEVQSPTPVNPPLTPREGEILWLVAAGLTNKEVACELKVSAATVKNHVHNLLVKLGLPRRGYLRIRYQASLRAPNSSDGTEHGETARVK